MSAALSAAAIESSVGGCGVFARFTVKVSEPLLRATLIEITSLPVMPWIAPSRSLSRPVPTTLPELEALSMPTVSAEVEGLPKDRLSASLGALPR